MKKPLGEAFFEFIEMDLSEYKVLHNTIINKLSELNHTESLPEATKIYASLAKEYPKTYAYINDELNSSLPHLGIQAFITCLGGFLIENKEVCQKLYNHPYIWLSGFRLNSYNQYELEDEIETNLAFDEIQEKYRILAYKCFIDPTYGEDLTCIQKYSLWTILGGIPHYEIMPQILYKPYTGGKLNYARIEAYDSIRKGKPVDLDYYKTLVKSTNTPLRAYCENVKEFLFFEFYELLKKNRK